MIDSQVPPRLVVIKGRFSIYGSGFCLAGKIVLITAGYSHSGNKVLGKKEDFGGGAKGHEHL